MRSVPVAASQTVTVKKYKKHVNSIVRQPGAIALKLIQHTIVKQPNVIGL